MLRVPLRQDHLSVISAIPPDRWLFPHVQQDAIRSAAVVQFLRQLLRLLPGELLVIWDGSPIHRSATIKAFLAAGATKRLNLARLPAYAPKLNSDAGVWHYPKYVELRNLSSPTLWDLDREVRLTARSLRRKRHVSRLCFAQSGCF